MRDRGRSCLICGDRVTRAFSAPPDVWSEAVGWDRGATYYHCRSCTGLTLWPRMDDDEYVRFYEHEQRSASTGFADDGIPEFHLQHKAETAPSKWGFFQELDIEHHVPAGGRVFEVGTAEGTLLALLRDKGYVVSGVEPLPGYAEFARSKFGLDVQTGYFPAQSPSAPPDVILIDNVLEHLPDPAAALRSIRAALPEGGVIVVLVPNVETPVVSNANLAHNTLWSRRSLEVALSSAGFQLQAMIPGRPVRRPHEWVALATAPSSVAASPPVLSAGPSASQVRRSWLAAIHRPRFEARVRRVLAPVWPAVSKVLGPLRRKRRPGA